MDDLENLNKIPRDNYYDKEEWDEDKPYPGIPIQIHKKFEELEIEYNTICVIDIKKTFVK